MDRRDDEDTNRFKRVADMVIRKRRAVPLGILGLALACFDEYRSWGVLAALTGIGLFLYCDYAVGKLKAGQDPMAPVRKYLGLGD